MSRLSANSRLPGKAAPGARRPRLISSIRAWAICRNTAAFEPRRMRILKSQGRSILDHLSFTNWRFWLDQCEHSVIAIAAQRTLGGERHQRRKNVKTLFEGV